MSELYTQLRQTGLRKGTRAVPITDIKEQVRAAGLTQKKLSELSGVSLTTINAAKRGEPISGMKQARSGTVSLRSQTVKASNAAREQNFYSLRTTAAT